MFVPLEPVGFCAPSLTPMATSEGTARFFDGEAAQPTTPIPIRQNLDPMNKFQAERAKWTVERVWRAIEGRPATLDARTA